MFPFLPLLGVLFYVREPLWLWWVCGCAARGPPWGGTHWRWSEPPPRRCAVPGAHHWIGRGFTAPTIQPVQDASLCHFWSHRPRLLPLPNSASSLSSQVLDPRNHPHPQLCLSNFPRGSYMGHCSNAAQWRAVRSHLPLKSVCETEVNDLG